MISVNAKEILNLLSCRVCFEDISLNKFKILSSKKFCGQFFLDTFFENESAFFVIINPTVLTLLNDIEWKEICCKLFLPKELHARFFLNQILTHPEINEWKISANDLKKYFVFTNAGWKSFLHRLPDTEKSLNNCGFLTDCKIEIIYQKKAGKPVDNLCISSHFRRPPENLLIKKYASVVGYSPKYTAYIIDQCCTCGGLKLLKRDNRGILFECCSNSQFWKFGNKNCNFREYIK